MGVAVAIMREEFAIVALLAHIIKIYKHAQGWADVRGHVESFLKFINNLIDEFAAKYGPTLRFFNTLRLLPELSGNRALVALPSGLDKYLRDIVPQNKLTDRRGVIAMLQPNNSIMGLRVPRCMNCVPSVAKVHTEEEKEEEKTAPVHEAVVAENNESAVFRDAPNRFCYSSRQNPEMARMEAFLSPEEEVPVAPPSEPRPPPPRRMPPPSRYPQPPHAPFRPSPANTNHQHHTPPESPPRSLQREIPPPAMPSVTAPIIAPALVPPQQQAPSVDLLGIDETQRSQQPTFQPQFLQPAQPGPHVAYGSAGKEVHPVVPRVSVPIPQFQPRPRPSPARQTVDREAGFVFGGNVRPPAPVPVMAPIQALAPRRMPPPPPAAAPTSVAQLLNDEIEKTRLMIFVNMKEVKPQGILGSGASADVFKGMYRGTEVAVKRMRQIGTNDAIRIKELRQELATLSLIRHPNLVLFMGVGFTPEGNTCILTEYCSGGTLFKLLHESPGVALSWRQRHKMALDVARGMNSLHSYKPPIVHRDLKSLNLLMSEPVTGVCDPIQVKITDFGLARMQPKDEHMTGGAGTFVCPHSR